MLELLDLRYRAWIACELFHVDRHRAQRLLNDRRVRRLGASRVERRLGVVFHCKLRKLCRVVAAQLREYHQTEVDSGGHAATRDPIAIDHHACIGRLGSERAEAFARRPMGGRLVALE